jgi:hypothetical protein
MAGATPMTPERKRAILNVWVENPTATYGEICKKANIGRATFYELRQQKPFMDEYHRLCQQKFDEAESLAINQQIRELQGKLAATDYQALKYSEGWITEKDYTEIKANRQSWRDAINQLQAQLKEEE